MIDPLSLANVHQDGQHYKPAFTPQITRGVYREAENSLAFVQETIEMTASVAKTEENLYRKKNVHQIFCLDTSGSMRYSIGDHSRLEEAKKCIKKIISPLDKEKKVTIITFNSSFGVAYSDLVSAEKKNKIDQALENITSNGLTAMLASLIVAGSYVDPELSGAKLESQTDLFMISDGEDNLFIKDSNISEDIFLKRKEDLLDSLSESFKISPKLLQSLKDSIDDEQSAAKKTSDIFFACIGIASLMKSNSLTPTEQGALSYFGDRDLLKDKGIAPLETINETQRYEFMRTLVNKGSTGINQMNFIGLGANSEAAQNIFKYFADQKENTESKFKVKPLTGTYNLPLSDQEIELYKPKLISKLVIQKLATEQSVWQTAGQFYDLLLNQSISNYHAFYSHQTKKWKVNPDQLDQEIVLKINDCNAVREIIFTPAGQKNAIENSFGQYTLSRDYVMKEAIIGMLKPHLNENAFKAFKDLKAVAPSLFVGKDELQGLILQMIAHWQMKDKKEAVVKQIATNRTVPATQNTNESLIVFKCSNDKNLRIATTTTIKQIQDKVSNSMGFKANHNWSPLRLVFYFAGKQLQYNADQLNLPFGKIWQIDVSRVSVINVIDYNELAPDGSDNEYGCGLNMPDWLKPILEQNQQSMVEESPETIESEKNKEKVCSIYDGEGNKQQITVGDLNSPSFNKLYREYARDEFIWLDSNYKIYEDKRSCNEPYAIISRQSAIYHTVVALFNDTAKNLSLNLQFPFAAQAFEKAHSSSSSENPSVQNDPLWIDWQKDLLAIHEAPLEKRAMQALLADYQNFLQLSAGDYELVTEKKGEMAVRSLLSSNSFAQNLQSCLKNELAEKQIRFHPGFSKDIYQNALKPFCDLCQYYNLEKTLDLLNKNLSPLQNTSSFWQDLLWTGLPLKPEHGLKIAVVNAILQYSNFDLMIYPNIVAELTQLDYESDINDEEVQEWINHSWNSLLKEEEPQPNNEILQSLKGHLHKIEQRVENEITPSDDIKKIFKELFKSYVGYLLQLIPELSDSPEISH